MFEFFEINEDTKHKHKKVEISAEFLHSGA